LVLGIEPRASGVLSVWSVTELPPASFSFLFHSVTGLRRWTLF
jgi:hypothetical protein